VAVADRVGSGWYPDGPGDDPRADTIPADRLLITGVADTEEVTVAAGGRSKAREGT
jgi:hypothetical protein